MELPELIPQTRHMKTRPHIYAEPDIALGRFEIWSNTNDNKHGCAHGVLTEPPQTRSRRLTPSAIINRDYYVHYNSNAMQWQAKN